MKKFIIGVSVGLVLIGVGLLTGVGKTERIAFGEKYDERQIPHISRKIVKSRKAICLSPAEMSIINGGVWCPCRICVSAGFPCEGIGFDCNEYATCNSDDSCGSVMQAIEVTTCAQASSGGKKGCKNDATAECFKNRDCYCDIIPSVPPQGFCAKSAPISDYVHNACRLYGDDC